MSQLERPWGGTAKIYTKKRRLFDELTDPKNPKKLPRLMDTFHVAAALGIRLGRADLLAEGPREELINVYTVDSEGVLWLLMSSLYPDASGQERFEKLVAHAEYGVERLAEEYRTFGSIQSALDRLL